jgi:hypothetical protein
VLGQLIDEIYRGQVLTPPMNRYREPQPGLALRFSQADRARRRNRSGPGSSSDQILHREGSRDQEPDMIGGALCQEDV